MAPTGGLELSTAAPGGAVSVLLLNGPAGGTIVDNGAGVEAAGTIGTAVGGLPLPLLIRATLSWPFRPVSDSHKLGFAFLTPRYPFIDYQSSLSPRTTI